jgi:predicted O-methyltransferase YrrM
MLLTRLLRQLLSSKEKADRALSVRPDPSDEASMKDYLFTQDWFSRYVPQWQAALGALGPVHKALEVGSYEGCSTVWLIENLFRAGDHGEIHCVDSWEGGTEHLAVGIDMSSVEQRFRHNIDLAQSRSRATLSFHIHKGRSFGALVTLLAEGHRQSFDLVYVDGSHQCPDVLNDLVLCFALCRVGGLIVVDDYIWSQEESGSEDLLNQPKLAVDSFVNCYRRKLRFYNLGIAQLYLTKTAE